MANVRKVYQLTPTCSIKPGSSLVLGNVVTNPTWPAEHKLTKTAVPIPSHLKPDETEIIGWSDKKGSSHSSRGGLFVEFLQLVGLGVTVSGGFSSEKSRKITTAKLETLEFQPDRAYIAAAMAEAGVEQAALKNAWYETGEAVFMVTGVKIARGPSLVTRKARSGDAALEMTFDAAPVTGGVPVNIGPKVEQKHSKEHEVNAPAMSDFVYAYRLAKIVVGKQGKPEARVYSHGAVLDNKVKPGEKVDLTYTLTEVDVEMDYNRVPVDMVDENGDAIVLARK